MPEPIDAPTLADVQYIIGRLHPHERAALRPWVLAKFDALGETQSTLDAERPRPPEHRLRRREVA
jgi:hypothetical protein